MSNVKNNNMIKELEMAEIFKVEIVDGVKRVSRWGFFAAHSSGKYTVYKPEIPVCGVDEYFMIEEDGPGAIHYVSEEELNQFINQIKGEIKGIAGMEVSLFTPCGWYYDTIV